MWSENTIEVSYPFGKTWQQNKPASRELAVNVENIGGDEGDRTPTSGMPFRRLVDGGGVLIF